jgi:hypothetical protein
MGTCFHRTEYSFIVINASNRSINDKILGSNGSSGTDLE